MINSGSTTTTLTLPSAADAYVQDGSSAGQNFGQTASMLVKNVGIAGFDRRSFVRFDLTGVAAADQITSAKVRLFGNLLNTAVTGMPVGLYSVANTTWSETALTWTNQPAAGATPIATKTVTGTTGAWYEFDVTNYLKRRRPPGRPRSRSCWTGRRSARATPRSTATRRRGTRRNWS